MGDYKMDASTVTTDTTDVRIFPHHELTKGRCAGETSLEDRPQNATPHVPSGRCCALT